MRLPLVFVLALGAPGCMFFTTKDDGETLKKELRSLQARVTTMQKRERETMDALKKARRELLELKDVLPKARTLLLRNSARFGLRVEKLSSDVAKLKGALENAIADGGSATKGAAAVKAKLDKTAAELERVRAELVRLAAEVRRAPPEPKTAAAILAKATILRLAGRTAEARPLYEKLIKSFPHDPRRERALLDLARMAHDRYDYRLAVVAAARLLRAYPKGRLAAAARLLSAKSYLELKHCKRALRIALRLLKRFPHAEATEAARPLIKRLRKIQGMRRYCR